MRDDNIQNDNEIIVNKTLSFRIEQDKVANRESTMSGIRKIDEDSTRTVVTEENAPDPSSTLNTMKDIENNNFLEFASELVKSGVKSRRIFFK